MAFDFRSIRRAVEDIMSINPRTGEPPFMFLDLEYEMREDGTYDTENLINARPVTVEQWMALPVRSCDLAINCGRGQLRAPTVIVAKNYSDIPIKKPKFSAEAIRQRDNNTCQATKRKLGPGEGNLAHDIAKTHGGKRNWTNIALLDRRLNNLQGTKTFAEMGWNIHPKEPKGTKTLLTIEDLKHESQIHFLRHNN